MCGGGKGGALAAISPALARCNKTDKRWKNWRIVVSFGEGEREAARFAMARRWSIASESHPPSVSTTNGTNVIPFDWHGRKWLFNFLDFICWIAAPGVEEDWGRADWLRGDVTATSKAVCRLRQLGRKMSPGRDWEFAINLASGTGERPACLATSCIASRMMSWRWIRSYSEAHVIVWSP